ncbi:diguanylate cyclase domain-containing protein [Methyloglobulus morosus]|uniref:diguanylate cyclase domain-containing protein n=1 Tax=Methyloglobulus morosus TaxID=1410681 RepID=UPI001910EFA8|nr:diguanylate cyclase [Methyloglobulus morosus]
MNSLENRDNYQFILLHIINSLNLPIPLDGSTEATVGASIGVTIFPTDSSEPARLLQHANHSMYQAKKPDRNRICLYGETGYN